MKKVKLDLFIRDAASFLNGHHSLNYTIAEHGVPCFLRDDPEFIFLATVEVDTDVLDRGEVTQKALDNLKSDENEKRARFQAQLDDIETRRQNILAITHKPGEWTAAEDGHGLRASDYEYEVSK